MAVKLKLVDESVVKEGQIKTKSEMIRIRKVRLSKVIKTTDGA